MTFNLIIHNIFYFFIDSDEILIIIHLLCGINYIFNTNIMDLALALIKSVNNL